MLLLVMDMQPEMTSRYHQAQSTGPDISHRSLGAVPHALLQAAAAAAPPQTDGFRTWSCVAERRRLFQMG